MNSISFEILFITFFLSFFTAPFGSQIKIEFRDQFHLEDATNCEYDFLEVRDGAFGYSTLIDKLCGPDFPRDIISSDRFIFLRFVSDDSIQYSGFRAVYSFIPNQSKFNIFFINVEKFNFINSTISLLFLQQINYQSHQVVSVDVFLQYQK